MTSAAAPTFPDASLGEDAWDDLLSFIEERRVIPIVGPVSVDTRQLPQPYSREEMRRALQDRQAALALLRLDPKNVTMQHNLSLALMTEVCDALWPRGRLDEAIHWCRKSLGAWANKAGP